MPIETKTTLTVHVWIPNPRRHQEWTKKYPVGLPICELLRDFIKRIYVTSLDNVKAVQVGTIDVTQDALTPLEKQDQLVVKGFFGVCGSLVPAVAITPDTDKISIWLKKDK